MSLRSIGVMKVLCSARHHGVRDLVALVLDLLDPLGAGSRSRVLDHGQKGPAPLDRLLSLLLEVGEKGRVVREEAHRATVYITRAAARATVGR